MKYNDGMAELIAIMEAIVGQYYHNEQKRGGFYFRYPVKFTRDGTKYECRGGHIPDLTIDELSSVHYKTGANSLYIGVALLQVLKFLEDRFAGKIDFTELEMEYQLSKVEPPFELFGLFDGGGRDSDEDEDSDLYYSDDESE